MSALETSSLYIKIKENNYIKIARLDHWIKHVFILPGVVAAYMLVDSTNMPILIFLMGTLSACAIASANYVINEWCDAEFDQFHPTKKTRPAAAGLLKKEIVYFEYGLLAFVGLLLGWLVSLNFFIISVVFLCMGLIYNVKPFRFKDIVFLDVICESVNNPLRMTLGWSMVSLSTIPPSSLLIAYWFGGAFLMAAKRLAEYRYIIAEDKMAELLQYRRSFRVYTEELLLSSTFLYGLLSSFFMAGFLIKYRNEFLFVFPIFAALFTYYLLLALRKGSIAQTPEKLHKDKKLIFLVTLLVFSFAVFALVDVPIAEKIVGIGQSVNYNFLK